MDPPSFERICAEREQQAVVLTASFRGRWFVRFLVLLPWTTPVALSAVIWLWMLDSIFSPFDWFAQLLHIVPPGGHIVFLGQSDLAMGSVIALQTWRILPLATVILMAGLSAIPAEVSDAFNAVLDGADYLMFAEETAIGKHPELAVEAVRKVIDAAASYVALTQSQAEAEGDGTDSRERRVQG